MAGRGGFFKSLLFISGWSTSQRCSCPLWKAWGWLYRTTNIHHMEHAKMLCVVNEVGTVPVSEPPNRCNRVTTTQSAQFSTSTVGNLYCSKFTYWHGYGRVETHASSRRFIAAAPYTRTPTSIADTLLVHPVHTRTDSKTPPLVPSPGFETGPCVTSHLCLVLGFLALNLSTKSSTSLATSEGTGGYSP